MDRRKPVVLILDDVVENVRVLGSILGRDKYSLLLANSGQQAINLALSTIPDVLLLDVMVPDIDGISVCRYLKEFESFRFVPVIFLTANGDPKDISLAYDAGGADYVLKPFHAKELRVRVETHLEIKLLRDRLQTAEDLIRRAYRIALDCSRSDDSLRPFIRDIEVFMQKPPRRDAIGIPNDD
jgi:CheY-like chemotaxis protein